MAPIGRHNIAKMRSSTTGTGTLTLSTAMNGFLTFALAGVVTGETVTYTIRDGANTEVGRGVYTSAGLTLTRATILSSTNAGAAISCTGQQVVGITIAAEDIQPFASYYQGGASDSVTNTSTADLTLDTELVDQTGLATLAANAVTLAKKGWYMIRADVNIVSGTAFNGRVAVALNGNTKQEGYTTAMGIVYNDIYIGPFLHYAAADGEVIGPVSITNNVGSTLTTSITELCIFKIGNV